MEIPKEGISRAEIMAKGPIKLGIDEGAPPKPPEDMAEMKTPDEMAAEKGLAFNPPDKMYNPHLAQELTVWAQTKGKWYDLYYAIYSAYFSEGKNISDISILSEIAESVGLPKQEAKEILETGEYREVVDNDWAESRKHGITAIPAYILGDAKLVHGPKYEDIVEMLNENDVKKHD
jgi:predicted DsbA family dithiol-disulfide isomerase